MRLRCSLFPCVRRSCWMCLGSHRLARKEDQEAEEEERRRADEKKRRAKERRN